VSGRRTRSPAAGQSAARAQVHPVTSAPPPPTSSARSAQSRAKGAALILPACNTEAMNLHLAEIAETIAPGAHAVLLVDQAGWHLSQRLVVPANITILALPPKCPELNPVENVWQFMRDNWLSNRVFKSHDDLVDHCCAAWNKLVDQPWRIMSIGLCQWAHGF
jgi:transposase